MTTFLAVVVVFGLLIAVHEFGHFIVAKWAGVQVDEYAIGFGPALTQFRRGETLYSLRLIPLGGYCKMAGMLPGEKNEADVPPGRAFREKSVLARIAIIIAGPVMNFLLAFVLFVLIFSVFGVPTKPTTTVGEIRVGSPAEQAQLNVGDHIEAVNGVPVHDWDEFVRHVSRSAGETISIEVLRQGEQVTIEVTPVADESGRGVIGIYPHMSYERFGLGQSLQQGLYWTTDVITGWFVAIGNLITGGGGAEADVIGPVGISAQIGLAAQRGITYLLLISAILSANLGLVNLLPIPALDGSRVIFLIVEAFRGRPVAPEKENFIHFLGFALLILLSIVITYRDVLRLTLG